MANMVGRDGGGGPYTNSVDVKKQPTVRDNGTNPSNKHWKSKAAKSIISGGTAGAQSSGTVRGTRTKMVHMNAGMTKKFGGKRVGKLA